MIAKQVMEASCGPVQVPDGPADVLDQEGLAEQPHRQVLNQIDMFMLLARMARTMLPPFDEAGPAG